MNHMNHSLVTADRSTHVRIVMVALVGALLVVGVGITARLTAGDNVTARLETHGPVMKAGKPVTVTSSDDTMVR
jgi:hypothetical protein